MTNEWCDADSREATTIDDRRPPPAAETR